MTGPRRRDLSASTAVLTVVLALLALQGPRMRAAGADPLANEISSWLAYVAAHSASGDLWTQVKQAVDPVLAGAQSALHDGRRLLALQRLSAARQYLAADKYTASRPAAERATEAGFEAAWTRAGEALKADLARISPNRLDGVRPAAVRALGEAALPQVRAYYEASLEYGRNTMPETGVFYIGTAVAEREFADLCRHLTAPSPRLTPPIRAIGAEIDALQSEVLAAYRPPAAIDRHSDFIAVSSALNEARELDASGLRYGALLRYLRAALRFDALRPPARADAPAVSVLLKPFEARVASGRIDHSIGQLLLEEAQADTALAPAIASDVLPRYFAALEPATPRPPAPTPAVTVTLVRWPYT